METVAKKRVRLPDIGEELFEHYPSMSAQTHEAAVKGYARKALSDAEARIKELEATIRGHMDNNDELATAWAAERARAEATEALLKEAGKALEPFAAVGKEMPYSIKPDSHDAWGYNDATVTFGHFRAARAVHHKIGVKDA